MTVKVKEQVPVVTERLSQKGCHRKGKYMLPNTAVTVYNDKE